MCVSRPYLSHLILMYCYNRWNSQRLNNSTNDKIARSEVMRFRWHYSLHKDPVVKWTTRTDVATSFSLRATRTREFYDGPNLSHGLLCLMFDEAITLDLWPPITTWTILIAFFIGFTINPPWTRVFVVLFVVGLWRLFSERTDVSN